MEDRQGDIVEQENSEELEAKRMIVLELTEKEAGTLSRNENIAFIEENIFLPE